MMVVEETPVAIHHSTPQIARSKKSSWRAQESTKEASARECNKTPENNHTKRERRTASSALHHFITQPSTARHQEGTSQLKRVPLSGIGKEVNKPLPHLSGHHMEDPLQVHPTQRLAKLNGTERTSNRAEEQGFPV